MSDVLYALADSLPLWRPSAITALALIVIGCVTLFVSVYDE